MRVGPKIIDNAKYRCNPQQRLRSKKNELDDPLKGLTLPQRRKEEAPVINQGQPRQ